MRRRSTGVRRDPVISQVRHESAGAVGCRRAAPPAQDNAATVTSTSVSLPPGSPILKQVRREPVAVADLATDEVIAPGKIEANPNRVSRVVAPVAGRVATVLVRVGDAVHREQPLFTIDSPDADAAMSADLQAEAAVTQARAALTKARADADRTNDGSEIPRLFSHRDEGAQLVMGDQFHRLRLRVGPRTRGRRRGGDHRREEPALEELHRHPSFGRTMQHGSTEIHLVHRQRRTFG